MKEKNIENAILSWLNFQSGIFAFKVQTGGFFDTKRGIFRKSSSPFLIPGTADIVGLAHGHFFALEVKTPLTIKRFLNYPTDADKRQKDFLEKVRRAGGIGECVCSVDEVIELFKSLRFVHMDNKEKASLKSSGMLEDQA